MNYDLALVDLTYRDNDDIDGEDILNALKEKYPQKPVIFRSAYSNRRGIPLNKKADGMILKRKYQPGQILDIINGYISAFGRNH